MVLDTKVQTGGRVIGHRAGVVVSRLKTVVGLLNNVDNAVTSRALALHSRDSPLRGVLRVVVVRERTGVGLVDVGVGGVNLPVDISGLLGNQLEQVGAAVPATERRKTPVSREGGDDGVVGVEGVVGGTAEVLGDSTTEEDTVDAVGDGVVAHLIEGEEDEVVLGEIIVLEQRREETVDPFTGKGDVGVVGIVGHVGGDEHVLGKAVVLKVLVEGGEVLDLARTHGVVGDGVEKHQWVVLAHVLVGSTEGVAEALVASMRHIFLVFTPGDMLGVEQIGNG